METVRVFATNWTEPKILKARRSTRATRFHKSRPGFWAIYTHLRATPEAMGCLECVCVCVCGGWGRERERESNLDTCTPSLEEDRAIGTTIGREAS